MTKTYSNPRMDAVEEFRLGDKVRSKLSGNEGTIVQLGRYPGEVIVRFTGGNELKIGNVPKVYLVRA